MNIAKNGQCPFGGSLRELLRQSYVTESELRKLLRSRGVFVGDWHKDQLIPLLSATILNPNEIDHLTEFAIEREESPKIRSTTVSWSSDQNLIDALPDQVDIKSLVSQRYNSFEIETVSPLRTVGGDPNDVELTYGIRRMDFSKDWTQTERRFSGSIRFSKNGSSVEVRVTATHSSNETESINRKVKADIISKARSDGFISGEEEAVKFSSFSNEERIAFLLSFSAINESDLSFVTMTDVDLMPDRDADYTGVSELKWMEKRVSERKINGDHLDRLVFLTDKKYHPYLKFVSYEALFDFDYAGGKGNFICVLGFTDYSREKEGSEFEVAIRKISFVGDGAHASIDVVKRDQMRKLDQNKLEQFRKFKEAAKD